MGQEGLKSPIDGSKVTFLNSDRYLNHLCILILFEYRNSKGILIFCKNHMSGKTLVLEL